MMHTLALCVNTVRVLKGEGTQTLSCAWVSDNAVACYRVCQHKVRGVCRQYGDGSRKHHHVRLVGLRGRYFAKLCSWQ